MGGTRSPSVAACRKMGVGGHSGLLQQPTPPPTASLLSHACFLWGVVRIAVRKLGQNCLGPLAWKLPFPPYLDLWLFLEKQFPAQMFPSTPTRPGFPHWASLKEESRGQAPSALFPLVPLPPLFQSPPSCSPMNFKTDETEASLAVQQSSQKRVPVCRGHTPHQ